MATLTFKEYKQKLIKSGKRFTVTKSAGGKVLGKTTYSKGKVVSFKGDKAYRPTAEGTIGGKYYEGVTTKELEQNKLFKDTSAREIPKRTQEVQLTRDSFKKLQAGTGTSRDLINVLSKGTGKVELFRVEYKKDPNTGRVLAYRSVKPNFSLARSLADTNQTQRFRNQVIKTLSPIQRVYYANLTTRKEKDNYLLTVSRRKFQPTQQIGLTKAQVVEAPFRSPSKGTAIITVKDPVTGKSTLVDYSKNVSRSDAQKFVDSLNEEQRIALVQDELTFRGDLRRTKDIGSWLTVWFDKRREEARKLARKSNLTKVERAIVKNVGIILLGLGKGTAQTYTAIRRPIKTLKEIYGAVATPVATFKAIGQAFKLDPLFTTSTFVGSIISTGAVISGVKGGASLLKTSFGKQLVKSSRLVSVIGKTSKFKAGTVLRTAKGTIGIVLKNKKVLILPSRITQSGINALKSAFNLWVDPITEAPKVVLNSIKLGVNVLKSPFGLWMKKNAILLSKIPATTKKFPKGTIFKNKAGKLYYVTRAGKVKPVPILFTSEFIRDFRQFSRKFSGYAERSTDVVDIKIGAGKKLKLQVAESIPKQSIKKQVNLSGKRVNAISSQGQELVNFFKQKRVIRKPIPDEAKLSKPTKALLKKFDNGKITNEELLRLDKLIIKQGQKGILERSFFADPSGIIRPSRLGTTALPTKAGFKDIVTGNFTIVKTKPQILLFDDIKVQAFPEELKIVAKKLAKGKSLTPKETNALLKWQIVNRSGKFKPLGFLSRESELTLAPREIIAIDKKVGFVISRGQKIPIVKARVIKPTGKLKSLLDDFDNGKLSDAQIKQLEKLLKQKTKVDYKLSSYKLKAKKYINLKSYTTRGIGRLSITAKSKLRPSKARPSKAKPGKVRPSKARPSKARPSRARPSKPRPSRPRPSRPKPSKPRASSPKASSPRPSKPRASSPRASKPRPSKSKVSRPSPVKPKPVPRAVLLKSSWEKRPPKGTNYRVNVLVKVGQRSRELALKTTPNRAIKYIKEIVDDSLAMSFALKIVGLTGAKDIKRQNLAKFTRRKGRDPKVLMFVEKRKHALDRKGEVNRIQVAKKLSR